MSFKSKIREMLAPHISPRLAALALQLRDMEKFETLYGSFRANENHDALAVVGLPTESGGIRGEIVNFIRNCPTGSFKRLLLAGENPRVKDAWARLLNNPSCSVVTAGLADDVDIRWNFEAPPPEEAGGADLVVSQAILEHLIDPYGHMKDLWGILNAGGFLLVLTVVPGFHYHRYPVDCVRFFPDWFEEVANRLGAKICDRSLIDGRITYLLQKES